MRSGPEETYDVVTTLRPPALVSSRPLAREFTAELADDLNSGTVVVDCADIEASAPSFVDELVKIILVERGAKELRMVNVPSRTAAYANRSAQRRNVSDRLHLEERTPASADF